jgi:predicted dithiol-disulfide oxidoreductase (DUF899 family)
MTQHKVVPHDQWLEARKKHLADEKEFTRARDRLSEARRELPWEPVEKEYVFEGPDGRATLEDMFDRRSQLVIYHAMFNPATASDNTTYTKDAPCFVCSWWMDNFERIVVHLNHHDVTMAAVSHAPYPKLAAYHRRMGWTFPWYSSVGSDFNFDYHVSFTPQQIEAGEVEYNYRPQRVSMTEMPGISVFIRDGGKTYHTYSTYERGLDMLNVAYHYLDIAPRGRNEGENGAFWVHRRDEYTD